MRLTCPNCLARYEVDAAVIPAAGRDVQCSNCGTMWFQPHPDDPAQEALAETMPLPGAQEEDPFAGWEAEEDDLLPPGLAAAGDGQGDGTPEPERPEPEPDRTAARAPAPGSAPGSGLDSALNGARAARAALPPLDAEYDTDDEEESAPQAQPRPGMAGDALAGVVAGLGGRAGLSIPRPARRVLDDDLLALLREEAEREVEARRAEDRARAPAAPPLPEPDARGGRPGPEAAESETPESETPESPAPARPAPAPAASDAPGPVPEPVPEPEPEPEPEMPPSRRGLLPDVEAVTSSLRPDPAPARARVPAAPGPSRGFRGGFVAVLAVAAAGVALYGAAPQITRALPAAGGPVAAYVGQVDAARLWLDGAVAGFTRQMRAD